MNKALTFITESFEEMKTKVTWPTTSELQSNSVLVLVASLVFALVIGLMDSGFKFVMDNIYGV